MACVECGGDVPQRTGGHQSNVCSAECRKARRNKTHQAWVKANREKNSEYQAAYRKLYREAKPDYFRDYYAANKGKRKKEAREWYSNNAEHALGLTKAYRAARPEWSRALGRKNRATRRARELKAFVDVIDHRVVFDRDQGICGICKMPIGASAWEVDHVIPLVAGGLHAYSNVQLAHRRCNRVKGAKVPGVAA